MTSVQGNFRQVADTIRKAGECLGYKELKNTNASLVPFHGMFIHTKH